MEKWVIPVYVQPVFNFRDPPLTVTLVLLTPMPLDIEVMNREFIIGYRTELIKCSYYDTQSSFLKELANSPLVSVINNDNAFVIKKNTMLKLNIVSITIHLRNKLWHGEAVWLEILNYA